MRVKETISYLILVSDLGPGIKLRPTISTSILYSYQNDTRKKP